MGVESHKSQQRLLIKDPAVMLRLRWLEWHYPVNLFISPLFMSHGGQATDWSDIKMCNTSILAFTCFNIGRGKIFFTLPSSSSDAKSCLSLFPNQSVVDAILTFSKNSWCCKHGNSPLRTAKDHRRNITAVWKDSWIQTVLNTQKDLKSVFKKSPQWKPNACRKQSSCQSITLFISHARHYIQQEKRYCTGKLQKSHLEKHAEWYQTADTMNVCRT